MNIMGMGWQEMMIIAVGALLIFGPDRLPEVAGQVGKLVRDLRKMTGDLTGELERTAGVSDIKKAVQSELGAVQKELQGVSKSVQGVTSSVNKTVSGATSSVKSAATASKTGSSAVSSVSKPASASTATTSTPTGKKADAAPAKVIASKKDPLADFAIFEEPAPPPKPAPVSAASTPATSNGGSPAGNDALGRARQRRAAAGYNRRAS